MGRGEGQRQLAARARQVTRAAANAGAASPQLSTDSQLDAADSCPSCGHPVSKHLEVREGIYRIVQSDGLPGPYCTLPTPSGPPPQSVPEGIGGVARRLREAKGMAEQVDGVAGLVMRIDDAIAHADQYDPDGDGMSDQEREDLHRKEERRAARAKLAAIATAVAVPVAVAATPLTLPVAAVGVAAALTMAGSVRLSHQFRDWRAERRNRPDQPQIFRKLGHVAGRMRLARRLAMDEIGLTAPRRQIIKDVAAAAAPFVAAPVMGAVSVAALGTSSAGAAAWVLGMGGGAAKLFSDWREHRREHGLPRFKKRDFVLQPSDWFVKQWRMADMHPIRRARARRGLMTEAEHSHRQARATTRTSTRTLDPTAVGVMVETYGLDLSQPAPSQHRPSHAQSMPSAHGLDPSQPAPKRSGPSRSGPA